MSSVNKNDSSLIQRIREAALATKEGIRQPIVTDGRRLMLGALEVLSQDPTNIQTFYEEAQATFNEDPLTFFTEYIKPFIGKTLYDPQERDGDDDPETAVRKGLATIGKLWDTVPDPIRQEMDPTEYNPTTDPARIEHVTGEE